MTRRMYVRRLRTMLRRRKSTSRDDIPRTRVNVPEWKRTHRVESIEQDLSQWVHERMTKDWDAVTKGNNHD